MSQQYDSQQIHELGAFFIPRTEHGIIAESTLSASATSITLSSIPANFRVLCLVIQARTDAALEVDVVRMRFNGDSGANYDHSVLSGNGAIAAAAVARAQTGIQIGNSEAANSRASNFSPAIFWIPGHSLSTQEKFAIGLTMNYGDVSADADMFTNLRAGRWRSAVAITSIEIFPNTGPNFVSGTKFQLFGF